MERYAMNSKRTTLAVATAALLAGASVTAASAQTQERGSTRMNAGQNLSTSGQMNAQGLGVNTGQQFQGNVSGRNDFSQTKSRNLSRNEFQSTSRNRSAMTSNRLGTKSSMRARDRDRLAFSGRDRFAFTNRDRFANGGWGGPAFDVSVGYGGWGWPGYYDSGYGYGYPGLYSYAPGYVGVGFGGGCSCGGPGWGGWR